MFVPLTSLILVALVQGAGRTASPPPEPLPATGAVPIAATRPLSEFAGTWKYNAELSVNAATGRPESARAVNERRGIGAGQGGAPISGGGGAGNRRGDGGGGGGMRGGAAGGAMEGAFGLYLLQQNTRRDLLEVAPRLHLEVTEKTVKVTDDLDRQLVFPVDGTKQKYQLGAAVFDARTSWVTNQLKNDIDAPEGLKMSLTWFLSEDGTKLFLIIRVGQPTPGGRPVGVNRVYDRQPAS